MRSYCFSSGIYDSWQLMCFLVPALAACGGFGGPLKVGHFVFWSTLKLDDSHRVISMVINYRGLAPWIRAKSFCGNLAWRSKCFWTKPVASQSSRNSPHEGDLMFLTHDKLAAERRDEFRRGRRPTLNLVMIPSRRAASRGATQSLSLRSA